MTRVPVHSTIVLVLGRGARAAHRVPKPPCSPSSLPEKESLARQFDRSPSTSLHGDEPPACDPRNECGVEFPELRLFLFALNLSSSSLSSSETRNSNGSTFFFARAMRLRMGGASAARAQLWQERGASRHAHALNRPLQQPHAPGAAFQVCPAPRLLQLKIT
jgi:hypothetical protein